MKGKILLFTFTLFAFLACNHKEEAQLLTKNGYPAGGTEKTNQAVNNSPSENQKQEYSLEQLDNTKGLSNSSVNCIFQDSENLLWIGTWDGLNRYDGNNFKIFRPEPDTKNSLSNQVVLKVAEDNAKQIWVLTMHGINQYNKKTDTFQHFYFSKDSEPPLSESQFNMVLNTDKKVFCTAKGTGLSYFNGTDFQLLEDKIFRKKAVKKLEFSLSGELFALLEDNSLYKVVITTASNQKKSISNSKLLFKDIRTFEIINNSICAVSFTGATTIFSSGDSRHIFPEKNIDNIVGKAPEGFVLSAKDSYFIVNPKGNKINVPWLKYLAEHKITTLIQGSEKVVWAGTDGDGIFKIYPLKKSFNLISKLNIPELDGGIVRTFLNDGKNSFWVGTKGKGLFCLPADFYKNPDKALVYKNFNESNSVINNAVYTLCKGTDDILYIGTDGEGITIYDIKASKLISWKEIEGFEKCDYFKSTYAIHQDSEGYIWLGTNGYGMIRCKIVHSGTQLKVINFKRYVANTNSKNSLSSNIIFSIIPRNEEQLWIGTRLGGLNLFDKKSGQFTSFKSGDNSSHNLSNNDILCLATDDTNKLWIGTSSGLNVLDSIDDRGKAVFKSFTVKDGLPNNTIHGIIPIKNSNIWISTNFGISNYSIGNKFINYSKNEGLQNNEFADGAFYTDPESGFIFMGGIKGFNYFLPEKIKESTVVPNLFIDRISGQNQPVPYYQSLIISPESKEHPSLVLKHNQNFFDIQLSALTYINNEKCQYAYQLKGFDKSWNTIGNRNIISFTNVPRGEYSLWLKWSNSDGVWSEPVQAIDMRIKPVWWQSNLATGIYIVLLLLFILFVRSYNLKKQSLKQNILIRKNEEELHENRLTFFTNIAHEFLTPLTLIVGPVQKLAETKNLNERQQKFAKMIHRNTSRLLFLTQQLLEFRKAEYDYLEITVKKFDLVSLIEQIAELFDDWAIDKNIDYKLDIPAELQGWYDKDKLEKIVFNLMSNAFKYTPHNGVITIKCSIENREYKTLNITITNTGKGIPKEKLESLFDRFFLSDTNQKQDPEMFRTGIGLAYVKKLVTVLRGEILASSQANAKTSFTVLLPCDEAAFEEKEMDMETAPVLISGHLKNILEESTESPDAVPAKISSLDAVANNNKKILIVEDEKEIHAYLNDLLKDQYTLITAYNGEEALEVIEKELPDIIISDVMMPVMDGVEFCKKIRADARTCHIPFIMLTAKSSVAHRIEGLESGANSYIPKPFYPEHLLVRIQKLLEEKELILKHFSQDTLIESLPAIAIKNDEKTFIKSVIDLIRTNVDNEALDSQFIEKSLGISTSQLYRKTKEIFNLSPGDLIRTIRLKYAAELLRKDQLTVSEICYKSGFNNRSYFYREFKKVYNTTPKNYQLQHKAKNTHFSNN